MNESVRRETKEGKGLSQDGRDNSNTERKEEDEGEQMDKEQGVCLSSGEEAEEGREAMKARTPAKVSEEEKSKHELTHTPFRAWCKFCVMGRGKNESHRKKNEDQKREDKEIGVPRICMDYFFLGEKDKEAKENPMLVMVARAKA